MRAHTHQLYNSPSLLFSCTCISFSNLKCIYLLTFILYTFPHYILLYTVSHAVFSGTIFLCIRFIVVWMPLTSSHPFHVLFYIVHFSSSVPSACYKVCKYCLHIYSYVFIIYLLSPYFNSSSMFFYILLLYLNVFPCYLTYFLPILSAILKWHEFKNVFYKIRSCCMWDLRFILHGKFRLWSSALWNIMEFQK
jgi:hypothetical protein